jgi:hypothetical protein
MRQGQGQGKGWEKGIGGGEGKVRELTCPFIESTLIANNPLPSKQHESIHEGGVLMAQ